VHRSATRTIARANAIMRPLKAVTLLTVSALAAAATILAPGTATGRAVPDTNHHHGHRNGPIALSAVTVSGDAYGPNEIATVTPGPARYRFLTALPEGAFDPDFTPDGQRILFWASDDGSDAIFSVPVTGGTLTKIPTGCSATAGCGDDNPAVSPNGKKLLTVRSAGPFDDNGCLAFVGIYAFRIDGTHPRRISPTSPACAEDHVPRWSPDGRSIVFQHLDTTGASLWIMRSDGSQRRQLTPAGMDAGAPDWSPNGRRIVFQSPDETPDDQTPQQLYTIHPDGSRLTQITHYQPTTGLLVKTNGPRWSPDGQKIVFAHLDSRTTIGPDQLHHADLFVMQPDGSRIQQINATPEKDNTPAWGPAPRPDHR